MTNTVQGLQTTLDVMFEYFNKWKLYTVNMLKSAALMCNHGGMGLNKPGHMVVFKWKSVHLITIWVLRLPQRV